MKIFNIFPILLIFALSGAASAQDESSTNRETMAAMHNEMAEAHTKMAECLASDRPIEECQQEMASHCSAMHDKMGKGTMGRGMMGKGMMGKGMMGKGMMGGMYGCPMMNDNGPSTNKAEGQQNKNSN